MASILVVDDEGLTQIRTVDPEALVMTWTGADTEGVEQEARQRGVTDFLVKGFSLTSLAPLKRVQQQEHHAGDFTNLSTMPKDDIEIEALAGH